MGKQRAGYPGYFVWLLQIVFHIPTPLTRGSSDRLVKRKTKQAVSALKVGITSPRPLVVP